METGDIGQPNTTLVCCSFGEDLSALFRRSDLDADEFTVERIRVRETVLFKEHVQPTYSKPGW